jgi:hypothetical protein
MRRIAELLAREEGMEKQRSQVDWLRDGDCNTGFFQAKVKERARINKIKAIKRSDETTCHNQKEIEEVAKKFYTNLFTAQTDVEPDPVTEWVPWSVTDNMNEFLSAPFIVEEIKKALFMMGLNKSPRPDGFTAGFFQKH